MKIRILENFNGFVNGVSVPFRNGQEVEINDADGDHFVRGPWAELIKPAVKVVEKPEIDKAVKVQAVKIQKGK
jgi:hypothetical protein